ncbi:unnamed protein product [Schistosoma mattheei]|uniref:Uncharacterized protein n=1 Tax=Schistosoma mattheei TaxID=31246 RepID=A0A183P6L8_9TREM|nr:unnamed protein product [Schistosoma mattheei]
MDTIGNLLAKYLGRGKHLPLEPYLLHIPYSLMMRNRFSIQSPINHLSSYYNNCQYDQNDIHKRHHHHHRHYHTFNDRLLIKQQNKTDFDDETNDKDFDKSKISAIWPAINPNNRIRNSIQASNSSMNIDLSTIGHRSRGSKCQKQTQQQQQYFTYPSARYSSGHRPPLCQNGHFPFELDPREYSSTNQSQEEINES